MSAETTLPEYIGSSEAMKISGFSRTTFYRRVKDGDIPCVRAIPQAHETSWRYAPEHAHVLGSSVVNSAHCSKQ